eukprot:TRINITY_DN28901_c0_g1_i1.p1 TRINITY_DN28901_c0_g1~~TRINITY_DN28901_c0_g1_i1.p1  ORF type:complete len:182 (-),score=51.74 TRINITY_DN28901_c0_g1_i1:78-623(-)
MSARRAFLWFLAPLLLMCYVARVALAGKRDEAYQAYAEKVYKHDDEEGLRMGAAISCAFCQIIANAVQKQAVLNKQRPREERYSEEQVEEVLLELCSVTAPKMAKSMNGYEKDAIMICNRVVKEHVEDMLDAASLGEDMDQFCKGESKLCPMGLADMSKMLEVLSKVETDYKAKEKKPEEL